MEYMRYELDARKECNLNDLEWRRKTYQHLIKLIQDEQLLLADVLHPETCKHVELAMKTLLNNSKEN